MSFETVANILALLVIATLVVIRHHVRHRDRDE